LELETLFMGRRIATSVMIHDGLTITRPSAGREAGNFRVENGDQKPFDPIFPAQPSTSERCDASGRAADRDAYYPTTDRRLKFQIRPTAFGFFSEEYGETVRANLPRYCGPEIP